MAIRSFGTEQAAQKLRLGMVGGGRGAFIGAVHRMAARLDDKWEIVAGALSADPENAKASGLDLGLRERAHLQLMAGHGGPARRSATTASMPSRS